MNKVLITSGKLEKFFKPRVGGVLVKKFDVCNGQKICSVGKVVKINRNYIFLVMYKKLYKLHLQNIILLYNYNKIYNYSVNITFIN